MENLPVRAQEMPKEKAMEEGAMALFGEKYGDVVRVLKIGRESCPPESVELCGGTHLTSTGEAGSFYIVSESAVAAGTRRIEAVTGWNAYNMAINNRGELHEISAILKSPTGQLAEKAGQLQDEIKKLRKRPDQAAKVVNYESLLEKTENINGVTLLTKRLEGLSVKDLLPLMDKLRGRFDQNAVICLAAVEGEKISLTLYVSKNLHQAFTAPELVRIVAAPCGGKGGGRPDLAQAGGTKPEGLAQGFADLKQFIKEKTK